MTELITPTLNDRKIAKGLGAKFNISTQRWTLLKNKETFFDVSLKFI